MLPRWALDVAALWARTRRVANSAGLMGGSPMLPVAGGIGDQPAALMDAFDLFDQWLEEMRSG